MTSSSILLVQYHPKNNRFRPTVSCFFVEAVDFAPVGDFPPAGDFPPGFGDLDFPDFADDFALALEEALAGALAGALAPPLPFFLETSVIFKLL
jgi:hypothetical protein